MAAATAMAIGGLAISAGSTAMSFMQAGEQSRMQRKAEAAAAAAMKAARKRLEINYATERAIKKEPFELAREAMLATGAQAIQAGVESERGAAATAGRVYMAQNEAQGGIRTAMGQELTEIEQGIIDEQSRLRDLNVQLDLGELEGYQRMAADAQEAKARYTEAGIKGIADTAQRGLNMFSLYPNTNEDMSAEGVGGAAASAAGRMTSVINSAQANSTPMSAYNANKNSIGPQYPQPGTEYGMFGTNFSGVGY